MVNRDFREAARAYIENYSGFSELKAQPLPIGLSKFAHRELTRYISWWGASARKVNNPFLDNHLYPKLKTPEKLTDGEVEYLNTFAEELASVDRSVVTEIYKALALREKARGNVDGRIRYTSQLGVLYTSLNGTSFARPAREHCNEILNDISDDIKPGNYANFSEETCKRIATLHLMLAINAHNDATCPLENVSKYIAQAGGFFARDDVKNVLGEQVAQSFNGKLRNCMIGISARCEFGSKDGLPENFAETQYEFMCDFLGEEKLCLLESAKSGERRAFLRELLIQGVPALHVLAWAETAYHSGNLSLEKYLGLSAEIVSEAVNIPAEAGPDFAAEYRLHIGVTACGILGKHYNEVHDYNKITYENLARRLLPWIVSMPNSVLYSIGTVATELKHSANLHAKRGSFRDYANFLEDILVRLHPPTFAHCEVVSRLTRAFIKDIYKKEPQILCKMLPKHVFEKFKKDENAALDEIELAAMLHDAGKIGNVQAVEIVPRKLIPMEFQYLIMPHPADGAAFFDEKENEMCHDIALGHQEYSDGKKGYPRTTMSADSPFGLITHIVTICDCYDAGTDAISRSHQDAKTFEQLTKEIIDGANPDRDGAVKYEPVLADFLARHPETQRRLRDILKGERPYIHYQAYCKACGLVRSAEGVEQTVETKMHDRQQNNETSQESSTQTPAVKAPILA